MSENRGSINHVRTRRRYPVGLIALLALGATVSCAASRFSPAPLQDDGDPIRYTISLPAPQTQMLDASMMVPNVTGDSLEIAMPVWRPGRYVVLDPAGTVREVRAFAGEGNELPIHKIEKSIWRVDTRGGTESTTESIRIDYRIYANSLADRTRHVDDTHAFLSGAAVFMYVPERRAERILVKVDAPEGWEIASGLEMLLTAPDTLVAANYDVLVDSPIEIGLHDRIEFFVEDKYHEIIIWGDPGTYDSGRLIEDFTKIIETQKSIWGDLPYERYVFIIHAGRGASGGTEHLNSTVMQTSRAALEGSREKNDDAYRRFLGLVSHEFFHTWNVKQLRPAGIHPYDYQRENYTDLLWVAEGTTSYYDDLTLARADLIDEKRYFDVLAGMIDSDRRRPGSLVQSLADSSFDAWIKFNKSTPDDVNSTVSFYDKGALVSLALDMEIRARTENTIALDDVLRAMYEQFPLNGPGYTSADLIDTIESLTESEFDAWFAAHVDGSNPIDYESALLTVGLELYFDAESDDEGDDEANDAPEDAESGDRRAEGPGENEVVEHQRIPLRATLGINLNGNVVRSVPSSGPAYAAGIVAGDELIAINTRRIQSADDLNNVLDDLDPGEVVKLSFFRHGVLHELQITLGSEPDGEWKIRRVKEPSDAQKSAYESWLWQTWPE